MSNSFNVMAENPNVPSGSNGCLCHELGGHDTAGPFVVFIGTETDNILAPYPVLCAGCACKAAELVSYSHEITPKPEPKPRKKIDRGTGRPVEDGPSI